MTDKRPREGFEEGKGAAGAPPAKRPESKWISEEAMAAAGIKAFALAQIERLGGGSPAAMVAVDRYMLYELAELVVPPPPVLVFGYQMIPREDPSVACVWKLVGDNWQPGRSGPDVHGIAHAIIGSRVYVIGTAVMAVYDYVHDEWKKLAPPPKLCTCIASAVAIGGMLHLIGKGVGSQYHAIYNPSTDAWTSAMPMLNFVGNTQLVTIEQDVYMVGVSKRTGEDDDSWSLVAAKFTPGTDTLGPLSWGPAYSLRPSVAVVNDRIYVFAYYVNVQVVDPHTLRWTDTVTSMPRTWYILQSLTAVDQYLYMLFLTDKGYQCKIYDTVTNSWFSGPDLPQGVAFFDAIVAPTREKLPFKEPVRPAVEWK